MKQHFTHRLPSHLTLLSDPWPDDPNSVKSKIEDWKKTSVLRLTPDAPATKSRTKRGSK